MPKLFGPAVNGLAIVVLATGLVGCRSTTTQLASVPGFGWLDRGDEGWANYEPGPGIPKPSATTEPTSGGPASALATKGKSPFADPVAKAPSRESNSRFDTDRYLPNKPNDASTEQVAANAKKSFGNYASAYGKFSPPTKDSKSTPGVQAGPYDVNANSSKPNFAAAGRFDSASPSNEGESNSRFNVTGGKTPQFTADSNSRFAAPAFSNSDLPQSAAGYTPPGFPKNATVENGAAKLGAAANQVAEQANRFSNDAVSNATQAGNNQLAKGQQAFNRFSNNVANTADNMASDTANAASDTFNRFSGQTAGNAQQFGDAARNAAASVGRGFGSGPENTGVANSNSMIDQAKRSIGNAVQGSANNVVSGAKDYAAGYQSAAAGAINDVKNRFGNVAAPATPSIAGTVQNATQGVVNQVQDYTQGAVKSLEQGVAQTYNEAKSSATNYANSAINNATQSAGNVVNSFTNNATQRSNATVQNVMDSAAANVDKARNVMQGYAGAGQQAVNNAMQNVSATGSTPTSRASYPATSTPNPFLKPPKMPNANGSFAPAAVTPPAANRQFPNSPSFAPGLSTPDTVTPPAAIRREAAPFLPGSTRNFQGATTVKKHAVELASLDSPVREPLTLAVGDVNQFPRTLR